jgi:hypothetical protein
MRWGRSAIDPTKVKAMGEFLYSSGISLDSQGKALNQRPDFTTFFTNDYFSAK